MSELEHIPDLRENRGYFSDVDRACRRWLERRGMMLTREDAAKLTRAQVRDFNTRSFAKTETT